MLALGVNAGSYGIVLSGLVPTTFFAFLELIYINLQVAVVQRSNHIERLLQEAILDPNFSDVNYRFGIGQLFEGPHPLRRAPRQWKGRPHVTILYGGLVLATALGASLVALAS